MVQKKFIHQVYKYEKNSNVNLSLRKAKIGKRNEKVKKKGSRRTAFEICCFVIYTKPGFEPGTNV